MVSPLTTTLPLPYHSTCQNQELPLPPPGRVCSPEQEMECEVDTHSPLQGGLGLLLSTAAKEVPWGIPEPVFTSVSSSPVSFSGGPSTG